MFLSISVTVLWYYLTIWLYFLCAAFRQEGCQNAKQQQKFSLRPLLSVHLCQAGANRVVADDAAEEKREEIRAALRIKVKGRKDEPYLRN